ncbi:HPP family protein [Pontibacter sp. JAM-7]|uniref:CBS domain-containing protein n=1 Tax=Pontibacter sp. JAM-7 TaxID=3366581 RepID=UPI003AF49174
MALYIYDHGYRIQTPKEALFPPSGVSATQQTKATQSSAKKEHQTPEEDRILLQGNKPATQQNRHPVSQAYINTAAKSAGTLEDRRKLTAAHIMVSPVITVAPYTLVQSAWQRMQDHEINHLLVADGGKPLGLVSNHDILEAGVSSVESIENLYSGKLIAATPETLVREVASSFIEHNINAMPIVDRSDNVVGIICRYDLLRLLVSGPHLERWV